MKDITFEVGQEVYVEGLNRWNASRKDIVTKIGRAYIHTKEGGRFRKADLLYDDGDYYGESKLWFSEEDLHNERVRANKADFLSRSLPNLVLRMSLEELENLASYLGIVIPN